MVVTADGLDDFLDTTDRLGGVGSADATEHWQSFEYSPRVRVDQALDPLGERYLAAMVELYVEISGRRLDQNVNEHVVFDLEHHVAAPTPYSGQTPTEIALHYRRLSTVLHAASLGSGTSVLDMGCGWGLSSELLAQIGLKVTAVDINPPFVELVDRRARRLGLPITAEQGNFDDYQPQGIYDAALFYESLHHAVRPHLILQRVADHLSPGRGTLLVAGEPIQDIWWKDWGLRLDPVSIYCMRKFGWFESGWSTSFLSRIMKRAGLVPRIVSDPDPAVGIYIVARRSPEPSSLR